LAWPAGVFDAVRGSYTFQIFPSLPDTYLALLSLRHPNLTNSFNLTKFHLAVVPNPATAAAAAAANASAAGDSSVVTAASLALFNPLVNPQVAFVVSLPDVAVPQYAGGSAKALADFKLVVAAKGALDGASWVQAAVLPGTTLAINATVSCVDIVHRLSLPAAVTELLLINCAYNLPLNLHARCTLMEPTIAD
jgi:hypothetical protein